MPTASHFREDEAMPLRRAMTRDRCSLSSRSSVAHQSVNKRQFKFLLRLSVYGSGTEKSCAYVRMIRLYAAQSIAGTVPSD